MKCIYSECNGTGFVPVTLENGEQEFKPCRCRLDKSNKDNLRKKLIEANIPLKYWDYTFENYLELPFPPGVKQFNKPNVDYLNQLLQNPKDFVQGKQVLWLWGQDDNSCHTTLATLLGAELLKADYKVLFTSFSKLLERFVDFDNKDKHAKELDHRDVYIIDDAFDITRASPGSFRHSQLFSFLDEALSNSKHFICTSNVPVLSIDGRFSQSKIILSRSLKTLELRGTIGDYLT